MTLCFCHYWKLARVLLCLCVSVAILIGLHSYYFGGVLILPLCAPTADYTMAPAAALQWDHSIEECSRGADLGCFHNCARATSITAAEKELLLYTLKRVSQFLDRYNFTYFLCHGSLLGMRRHGGLIPWDDDIDLCLLAEEEARLIQVVNDQWRAHDASANSEALSIQERWRHAPLRQSMYVVRKIFLDLADCHKPVPVYCWPFIDLIFVRSISPHSASPSRFQVSFTFETFLPWEQIHPLRREYFDGVAVWTPHRDDAFLSEDMMTHCCTRSFNHKYETFRICTVCVPCERVAKCVRNYTSLIPTT